MTTTESIERTSQISPRGTSGLIWLMRRETLRVRKVWTQTVLAPIVSSALFIVVFGFSLGGRIRVVEDFPLVPTAWIESNFRSG